MSPSFKALLPVWVLVFASFFWGLSWWPLKTLNQLGFEGPLIILVAYGLLSLAFLPWILRYRAYIASHFKAWFSILLLGGGANLAFNFALIEGEVIRVMVLFYLLPLWGVLGGKFLLHEKVGRLGWLAAGLAISGAFLIVGGFDIFTTPPTWIDGVALLSGFLFAMNNLAFRAHQDLPLVPKLGALFIGTLIFSGILCIVAQTTLPTETSSLDWFWLAGYGLVWLLIANLGSQWSVTHLPASRSSIIMVMELVVAVVSAILIGNETLHFWEAIGGLLILSATLLEAFKESHSSEITHQPAKS
ncbi:DMT family transporter [Thiosulfativibrio zosterae]|uniref:EamA domain-containing protein n=1 Tax=Thiosulfativibrio zosterae TaxID=2675053 RepID=A0A6F8PP54_9GAMM|nr:DMT family transporter [Thiosulfativibrio zosterae]BBP43901.1 hypothetical protein THMIRHAT_16470 [Thiosulfativibrio zosterae]